MTDAERLLATMREIIQREIYPVRQRIGALGLGNAFTEGRLSKQERLECWILVERLVGETTRLIQMLGIAEYVGKTAKDRARPPLPDPQLQGDAVWESTAGDGRNSG